MSDDPRTGWEKAYQEAQAGMVTGEDKLRRRIAELEAQVARERAPQSAPDPPPPTAAIPTEDVKRLTGMVHDRLAALRLPAGATIAIRIVGEPITGLSGWEVWFRQYPQIAEELAHD